jgi:type IV pilus assembly protein PilB
MPKKTPAHEKRKVELEELLLRHGSIDEQQLARARAEQKTLGGDLGRILVDLGFVGEELLVRALAHQLGIKMTSPDRREVSPELLRAVPVQLCERFGIVPVAGDPAEKTMLIATNDPANVEQLRAIEAATGFKVQPVVATSASIERGIRLHYYGENPDASKRARAPWDEQEPSTASPSTASPSPTMAAAVAAAAASVDAAGAAGAAAQAAVPLPSAKTAARIPPASVAATPASPPPSATTPVAAAGPALSELRARIERLEDVLQDPQFAALVARVERIEQVVSNQAQALRFIAGLLARTRPTEADAQRLEKIAGPGVTG